MVITYHGDNYFKLQSGNLAVLIDPTNARSFKGAQLVISTLHPPLTPTGSEVKLICHQGEYEIHGIAVRGWTALYEDAPGEKREKTIYRLDFEDFRFVILGYLTKELDAKALEHLEATDVLILPAGGKPFVSEVVAAKLVRALEPAIVIPALYKNPKGFLKEFGQNGCAEEEKLVVKKKDLTPKAMAVKCLKP